MTNRLRIAYFSEGRIKEIYDNALDVLENVGFKVQHDLALRMLRDCGAEVDFKEQVVKAKPDFVEKCLSKTADCFLLGARDLQKSIVVGTNPSFPIFRNGGGADKIIDINTGELRDMSLKDVKDLIRVLDALDFVDVVSLLYPHNTPVNVRDLVTLEVLFKNTSKHVNIRTFSKENLNVLIKMGEIVAGGTDELKKNPVFSLLASPISPLVFPELTVDVFLATGKHGIPLYIANFPIAGATGPFPLVGMAQLLLVEFLASMVICQTANPGAPIFLHPLAMTMDWQTMLGLTASVEVATITAGITQVANEIFNMPVDVHGPWSDTYVADSQSAIERTLQTLLPALSGASSIVGFGDIQGGLAFCPTQLILDEELAGVTLKLLEGIPTDEDRLSHGNWMKSSNRKDINFRAKERFEKLRREHRPEPLDKKVEKELKKLLKSVE